MPERSCDLQVGDRTPRGRHPNW